MIEIDLITLFALIIVSWLAATISGTTGFGGALLLLPVLILTVGAKAAVPILTVTQILSNISRAGFGWKEIQWKSVMYFAFGCIPASFLGSYLFVKISSELLDIFIAIVIIVIVLYRRFVKRELQISRYLLLVAGFVLGFLSAIIGSVGPLQAITFLGLGLPATAYVATEAGAASLIHFVKLLVYGKYKLFDNQLLLIAILLGVTMIAGSWTGRKIIERVSIKKFNRAIEFALVIVAIIIILK